MEHPEGSVEQAQQRILEKMGVAPAETEEQELETAEATEETSEAEAPEAETPEAEEAQAEEGEVEITEAPSNEEATVTTLHELAEAIEVEPDFIYTLKIPHTDPSGQRGDFTLSEIKDSFQEFSKLKDERQRFEQDRQTFEKERQEAMGRLNERLTVADSVLQGLEAQLDAELNSPEMEEKRKHDPAEWTAQRQEIEDRKRKLREQQDALKTQAQTTSQEQLQELETKLAQSWSTEFAKLRDTIPEWKDPETEKADIEKMVNYLQSMGASTEELLRTPDMRLWALARKAMMFDEGNQKVSAAKKKVKVLPKRLKPSTTTPAKDAEDEAVQKRRERLRKTGHIRDAQAVIADRLFRR
jgi:hypothetical protein